jgi:hypothetical protein
MAGRWFLIVVVATAALSIVGVMSARAATDTAAVEGAHAAGLVAFAWAVSCLRFRRRNDGWRVGFELSPVSRVRAMSTVRRARRRMSDV